MPDLSGSSVIPQSPQAPQDVSVSSVPSGAKEVEPAAVVPDGLRDATGQETVLSGELQNAGVKIHPTSIPIPPNIAQMGVKPAGNNIPVQTTTTVVLPLTDDEIARGLHLGVTNSLRWLAEWCVRKYKQLHIAVKTVGGKLIRTKVP